MQGRRHDTCPNIGFVPIARAKRDEFQKPLRMTRDESMEAARNRWTYLIAAIRTGRRAIGIEIDERHFRTAVERVKRELAQPMLPAIAPQRVEQQDLLT